MSAIEVSGPNAEQIKYWNERGQTWVQLQDMLDRQLRGLGELAMDRAAISAGERVLDIGCGCGDTSVTLAQRVGKDGAVHGIDISTGMLQRARERAAAGGLTHVTFENADAQTHPHSGSPFDLIFSRFGVMFFTDPTAAFTNLRTYLRPAGRLSFVCWQGLFDNPWMVTPLMAAAPFVELPPPPPAGSPGPFAFAERERVEAILGGAGFRSIGLEDVRATLSIAAGGSIDQTVDFLMQMGPVAQLLRDRGAAALVPARQAIATALAPFETERGIEMPSAAWIVTAIA